MKPKSLGLKHVNIRCGKSLFLRPLPGRDAKYCDKYVWCLFVCLSVCSHNSKTAQPLHQFICACCLWPWLGLPLTALRYVLYFRFYG